MTRRPWEAWKAQYEIDMEKLVEWIADIHHAPVMDLHIEFQRGGHPQVFDIPFQDLTENFLQAVYAHYGEPNDSHLRKQIQHQLEQWAMRHDYRDFTVMCNEVNNTPQLIDQCGVSVMFGLKVTGACNACLGLTLKTRGRGG